jgi:putative SOS response-associated peptidase YedK
MCGRYFLHRGPASIAQRFGTVNPLPNFPATWNLAPTQDGLVVRRHPENGARHLDALRWGLVPRWAKDPSLGARMINARAESLAERPAFRDALRKRRCIVAADGFYEWPAGGAAPKQPYAVALASGEPMALAGLWEVWRAPDGTVLRSFAIVTTAAGARLAALHPRMPAILPREAWPLWLGEAAADGDAAALRGLLRPCPEEWLAVWPVSARVNRVAENDPGLLARDPAGRPLPGLDDRAPALG